MGYHSFHSPENWNSFVLFFACRLIVKLFLYLSVSKEFKMVIMSNLHENIISPDSNEAAKQYVRFIIGFIELNVLCKDASEI